MNSILELKEEVATTFDNMKEQHAIMGEKVERGTFKLTTMQSDTAINNDFYL